MCGAEIPEDFDVSESGEKDGKPKRGANGRENESKADQRDY